MLDQDRASLPRDGDAANRAGRWVYLPPFFGEGLNLALQGLLLEARVLAPLAPWEPVGARLESLLGAVRGHGSLTEREIGELRIWARRWTLLAEPLRAFYLLHLEDDAPTARVVLWAILNGKKVESWKIRKLEIIWEEDTGYQPIGVDLAPRLQ